MSFRAVIVDDDKVTLTMLEKALTDAGLEVLKAEDGMKALSLIQSQSPDLVISDLLIPTLHGLELCERIRQNALLGHVTIVLMSAIYDYETFRQELEGSQADYFITKPLHLPDLVIFVKKILKDKEQDED